MTETDKTTCPHCDSIFEVAASQLQQARGRVRCGNCLRVFHAQSGDMDFVAPVLREGDEPNPLSDFSVRPMSASHLPQSRTPPSRRELITVSLLILLLIGQILIRQDSTDQQQFMDIRQLVVRKHPQHDDALRLDAILRNAGDESLPLPALDLLFSNRFGEARAQRSFIAEEYLHGSAALTTELKARSEIQISLLLQDPGRDAVNYSASLRSVTNSAH
jgi:predicted Zn finger-like uncharacterized protein